ncbi:MAG: glutamate formimidoyltransferase [Mangrovibacterium sp.]
MKQIMECVPNFSEGRDPAVIAAIREVLSGTEGVRLLHVDAGHAANRTVMTFAGTPEAVQEAAFRAIRRASELIDMRKHRGEHPRFGATDVCPLIPVRGISLDEAAAYAHRLGKRVGEELGIPVYCYEAAATAEHRQSLAACRAGEYEGLSQKMRQEGWLPDYGPDCLNERSGAVAVGARSLLIAWNVNLNTRDKAAARTIAGELRESGIPLRDPETGLPLYDAAGRMLRRPGRLKKVRAIGWYMAEYGRAQVSMNLLDYRHTPMHKIWEAVAESAGRQGLRITGSELVGLIPLEALTAAGAYFLRKAGKKDQTAEQELIQTAVREMGLDELAPFCPEQRILEYLLNS